jgi:hypothetical protein
VYSLDFSRKTPYPVKTVIYFIKRPIINEIKNAIIFDINNIFFFAKKYTGIKRSIEK